MSQPPFRPAGVPSLLQLLEKAIYNPQFSPVPTKQETQSCQLSAKDRPCACVRSLSVKCGHSKRTFVLKPPLTKTNAAYEQVIQVLAYDGSVSPKANRVQQKAPCDHITMTLAAGACVKGIAGRPAIQFGGVRQNQQIVAEVQATDAVTRPIYLDSFIRYYLGLSPSGLANVKHGVVDCCNGSSNYSFRVETFPYRKWEGKISIGYELSMEPTLVDYNQYVNRPIVNNGVIVGFVEEVIPKRAKLYKVDDEGTFKITGSLEATFGNDSSKVELPTFEKGNTPSSSKGAGAFSGLRTFFEKTLPRLNSLCSNEFVTLTPLWPNVTLGGKAETIEKNASYDVAWEGEVSLGLTPLFGLSGTTDLLAWLIVGGATLLGAPYAGQQLVKIKRLAEKGFGDNKYAGGKVVCKIDFTASGKIGGTLTWAFKAEGKDTATGGIQIDLDFELKGEVSVEVRFLVVSYTAGASITGSTGGTGEIVATFRGDDPLLSGALKFKGLTVEAVTLQSVGGSSVGTSLKGEAAILAKKKKKQAGTLNAETVRDTESTSTWKIVVLEPDQWPKSPEAQLCDEGAL